MASRDAETCIFIYMVACRKCNLKSKRVYLGDRKEKKAGKLI